MRRSGGLCKTGFLSRISAGQGLEKGKFCITLLVFARESAEDLFSADPVLGEVDLRRAAACLSRCELVEGAVRPGGVVVVHVLGQHLAQVVLVDDQQPVEKLAAQRADHPLADGICCLRWAEENPDACCCEHGVEGIGELARAIPDQEPE